MSTLSAHVLDAALGAPAVGVGLSLTGPDGAVLETATTDDDGRAVFAVELVEGTHHLLLETGAWFAAADRDHFHPEITVAFGVRPDEQRYHLAVLLSPYAYTTYRGS